MSLLVECPLKYLAAAKATHGPVFHLPPELINVAANKLYRHIARALENDGNIAGPQIADIRDNGAFIIKVMK